LGSEKKTRTEQPKSVAKIFGGAGKRGKKFPGTEGARQELCPSGGRENLKEKGSTKIKSLKGGRKKEEDQPKRKEHSEVGNTRRVIKGRKRSNRSASKLLPKASPGGKMRDKGVPEGGGMQEGCWGSKTQKRGTRVILI